MIVFGFRLIDSLYLFWLRYLGFLWSFLSCFISSSAYDYYLAWFRCVALGETTDPTISTPDQMNGSDKSSGCRMGLEPAAPTEPRARPTDILAGHPSARSLDRTSSVCCHLCGSYKTTWSCPLTRLCDLCSAVQLQFVKLQKTPIFSISWCR